MTITPKPGCYFLNIDVDANGVLRLLDAKDDCVFETCSVENFVFNLAYNIIYRKVLKDNPNKHFVKPYIFYDCNDAKLLEFNFKIDVVNTIEMRHSELFREVYFCSNACCIYPMHHPIIQYVLMGR